ncbi:MAG: HNH endonuclease [bacterium]|nr:HNH endonuclease [bacterium]
MTNQAKKWNGSKWIRPEKRLAIYLRDGLACAYCGANLEDGGQLTLDHLKPRSKGGDNKETNLVTCCKKCNSSRGNRSVRSFCRSVATYINHGAKAEDIEKHVRNCSKRKIDVAEAKNVIARRRAEKNN